MAPRPDGPFACQEARRLELHRVFLLPMLSLVKCIPERPMHAGVIVMASPGIPRHQEPARALSLWFVPLYPLRGSLGS